MKRGGVRLYYNSTYRPKLRKSASNVTDFKGTCVDRRTIVKVDESEIRIPLSRATSSRRLPVDQRIKGNLILSSESNTGAHTSRVEYSRNNMSVISMKQFHKRGQTTIHAKQYNASQRTSPTPSRNVSRRKFQEVLSETSGFLPQNGTSRKSFNETTELAQDKYRRVMKKILSQKYCHQDAPDCHKEQPLLINSQFPENIKEENLRRIILNKTKKYHTKRRKTPTTPNLIIKESTNEAERERALNAPKQMRKVRIKSIYEKVLFKAGHESAKKLLSQYFEGATRLVNVGELQDEVEKQREQEIINRQKGAEYKLTDYRKAKKSTSRVSARTPSPTLKRDRIRQYGKWYLNPENFADSLYNKV